MYPQQPGESRHLTPLVDNRVTNQGVNSGSMTGGTVNLGSAIAATPSRAGAFDPTGRGVFINYRRVGDHAMTVLLLQRELVHRLGASRVFFDNQSIPAGSRYPDRLWIGLHASRIVLVVVHPTWLDELDLRRGTGQKDWVAFEIEAALTAGKTVLPVLVNGASMPAGSLLPEPIRDLAHRTARRLVSLPDDVVRLVDVVEHEMGPPE